MNILQGCDLQHNKRSEVPLFVSDFKVCWIKAGHIVQTLTKYCWSIFFGIWSLLHLDLEPINGLFISLPSAEQNIPCVNPRASVSPTCHLAEVLVILLCAERGSVFAPSRRKACKRWKTGPPAGWLFAPSRPTPKATESWKQGEAGKGYVGTSRNVLSACRRGEPAQPWAGTDTVEGCSHRRGWAVGLHQESERIQTNRCR